MSVPVSLVTAATSAARRMIAGASSATAEPSSAADGFPFHGADWLHVYTAFHTATTCTIVPYFYSEVAGLWYAADSLSLASAGDTWSIVEVRGESRVYLRLTAIDAGTIDAWGAYSFDQISNYYP